MEEKNKSNKKKKRSRRRKQRDLILKASLVGVLLIILAVILVLAFRVGKDQKQTADKDSDKKQEQQAEDNTTKEEELKEEKEQQRQLLMAQADLQAAQYDYDAAMATLNSIEGAAEDTEIQEKLTQIQQTKDSCVPVNMNEVTHIFYHSLVVDPEKGFAGNDSISAGFKQWMTTVDEFNKITQSMYEKGYVMVSLHDLVEQTVDADGTVHFKPATIMLPPGKKAYVLSLDDLCYYHSYDNRGIASKIVLDENGKPTCEYIQDDGTVVTGAYDCVPLMDAFVEQHPDASYRGAKGIIALTGYNGILGYRTDGVYNTSVPEEDPEHFFLSRDQQKWLDEHPDFNWDQECAEAKKVADAMKADGWEFASHTWGHQHVADISYDKLVRDTERWAKYVAPLVGGTDTIIFAHGQDLTSGQDYTPDNEKFTYLKSQGFNFFCNVDSTQYWLKIEDNYLRMGRRNLDGYRLWKDAHGTESKTSDLFDAKEVLDQRRTDVPDL